MEVVVEANTCDQLTHGRYMIGLGMGFAPLKAEQRGVDVAQRRAMMHESIDFILKTYAATEPFDFHGEFFHGRNIDMRPPPYQKPHPPIGIACHETRETAELAGRFGFKLLFSQADTAGNMRGQMAAFTAAAQAAGRVPRRTDAGIARLVYVSDGVARARDELRESVTAYVEIEKQQQPHILMRTIPPGGTLDDVNFDYLVDIGHYIVGDPDTVTEQLLRFYARSGGFGLLMLLAGKDYGTREQRARSMRLFMDEVAPRLRDLDPDRDAPS
jgi:alkanesulfonate monooxygenase SsuD/methylene tetrahydromethanopterin reductase-like flavin-dependent oxidoreductase (luciferase family)